MELLCDVVFKDAVTEPSVPRTRLDQLAKSRAIHVVKYALNKNSDGHVLLPVKAVSGWQWGPAITQKVA
jgi:hypothetical protein